MIDKVIPSNQWLQPLVVVLTCFNLNSAAFDPSMKAKKAFSWAHQLKETHYEPKPEAGTGTDKIWQDFGRHCKMD